MPNNILLILKLHCLAEELLNIPGITPQKVKFVSAAPSGEGHRFYVQIKNDATQTKDGYKLAIIRNGGSRNENFTHLSAKTEIGKLPTLPPAAPLSLSLTFLL